MTVRSNVAFGSSSLLRPFPPAAAGKFWGGGVVLISIYPLSSPGILGWKSIMLRLKTGTHTGPLFQEREKKKEGFRRRREEAESSSFYPHFVPRHHLPKVSFSEKGLGSFFFFFFFETNPHTDLRERGHFRSRRHFKRGTLLWVGVLVLIFWPSYPQVLYISPPLIPFKVASYIRYA